MNEVAVIRAIFRYPVKSMRGEELPEAELTLQGFPFDRQYAFVQANSRSIFPWLTGREYAGLLRYRARVEVSDAGRPDVVVVDPDGDTIAVHHDALRLALEERSGRPLFLLRDYRGSQDAAQVSLIGDASIAQIGAECGTPVEPSRFRANLYLETISGAPFEEDGWVGSILRIGDTARIAITEQDKRCAMITLHPETGEARTEVLTAVARNHNTMAGIYGSVLTPGPIRPGDAVRVESS
ncbi:MAG: MOSC domain-containing protein [Dehalococcoidia bacterium]